MRGKARTAGRGLLAVTTLAVAVVVTVGALRAHGDAEFNRWVGWATIAAVPIAALGVVLVLWDKVIADNGDLGADGDKLADELAAAVLAEARIARSRLIGTDGPSDQAANARFTKVDSRFRDAGGPSGGSMSSVLAYYQSLSPQRLVVLGEPGSGKTVLVLELQVRVLEGRQQGRDMPVPVLVSASAYDVRLEWEEWLARHLAQRFAISRKAAARLVRDRRIVPFVDGLDEMDAVGKPERAAVLVRKLNGWMSDRGKASLAVTCRRGEYEALARGVDRATHIELLTLTGKEAAAYLEQQFLDAEERHRWEPVLSALRADPAGPLAAQLATPWRLTLALTVFRDSGDPAELLPPETGVSGAYARTVDRLLLGGYVAAAVRLHDPDLPFASDQVPRWLNALADGLARQARGGGSAIDIRLDLWKPAGRKVTEAAHVLLTGLPGLVLTIAAAGFGDLSWAIGGLGVFLVGIFYDISLGVFDIGKREPIHLQIRHRPVQHYMVGFLTGIVHGVVYGVPAALLAGPALGMFYGLVGLATGAVLGISAEKPPSRPVGPRDVIRGNGRTALVVGTVAALSGGLVLGPLLAFTVERGMDTPPFHWDTSLAETVGFGIIAGLYLGFTIPFVVARAWSCYYLTVLMSVLRRRGPLRFGAFLDWAQQAGLLRVSGNAYQFRHRQLQDWLTTDIRERHHAVLGLRLSSSAAWHFGCMRLLKGRDSVRR